MWGSWYFDIYQRTIYPDLSLSQIWRSFWNIETITILSFLGALNFWCYLPWASSKPSEFTEFTYHYAMQRETRGIKVSPLCCGYLICQLCQLSSAILKFIDLWFFSYFISKLHTTMASPFWSNTAILSSAKNSILDNKIVSLTSSKSLYIADQCWKMTEFQYQNSKSPPNMKEPELMISQVFLAHQNSWYVGDITSFRE